MKVDNKSRRMFLQGSGGALLSIPFLASLMPRSAWAQSTTAPKRFVSIIGPYDIGHNSVWLPNGSTNIANIPQPSRVFTVGNGHHDIRWQPLRDFAPTNSSSLGMLYGSALSPYLESMNILRSLDFADYTGHCAQRVLGGMSSGNNDAFGSLRAVATIDDVLAKNRNFNPAGRPLVFAGTETGGGGTAAFSLVNNNGTVTTNSCENQLRGLYNRLFTDGTFPETGTTVPAHRRRDLLTRVLEDYTRVMNSRNISSLDRATLSDAMDKLSDVHRSLAATTTAGQCSHRALVKDGNIELTATQAQIGKAMADMITAAIMCDASRVFTIGANMMRPPYITNDSTFDGQPFDHDATTHRPFDVSTGKPQWQRLAERQSYTVSYLMAPLLQNLSAATDPANGRSYLYNSLVYLSFEAGLVHGNNSHPAILAGNAGGAITSGNYIDYANRANGTVGNENFSNVATSTQFTSSWRGVSYNRLLVTILQAMGLTPAEYENSSLGSQFLNRTDIGAVNANLTSIGGYGYPYAHDLRLAGNYGVDSTKPDLRFYDLKQFRNKLPML